MDDVLKQQKDLYQKAEAALKDTDLINILSKYGQAEIVGSVALKVVTRRDIDLEVIVDNPNRDDVAEIIKLLVKQAKNRVDFDITDYTAGDGNPNHPKGFYVGMKYFGDLQYPERNARHPDVWTIDIWFVREEYAQGRNKTSEIKQKLTKDKRKTILEIKFALKDNPNYHKKYGGVDIYEAVLDKNVTNLEQFGNYLKEFGREL